MQQTNATWSKVVVTNIEAILAKNLSHNFQVMTSVTRQWQHLDGTWNPDRPGAVHPARRVPEQPRPVAAPVRQRRRQQPRRRRQRVGRRLSAILGAHRRPVLRAVGHPRVGELRHSGRRLSRTADSAERRRRSDLRPGPRPLANGTTQPNPLATTWRFANATRGDGQFLNETARYLQLNLGRTFKFGSQSIEAGLGIFNVFNTGAHTQWNTGAQRVGHGALSVALQPASAAGVPDHARLQVLSAREVRSSGFRSSERSRHRLRALVTAKRRNRELGTSEPRNPGTSELPASEARMLPRFSGRLGQGLQQARCSMRRPPPRRDRGT